MNLFVPMIGRKVHHSEFEYWMLSMYICARCDHKQMHRQNIFNMVQAAEFMSKQIFQRWLFSVWQLTRAIGFNQHLV